MGKALEVELIRRGYTEAQARIGPINKDFTDEIVKELADLRAKLKIAEEVLERMAKVNSPDDLLYENIAREALKKIRGD